MAIIETDERSPFDPREYAFRNTTKSLAVFDCETDPFKEGRTIIAPFTCGFYECDTGNYFDFWGDDCIDQFFAWLATRDKTYMIFVHNLGGFDYHFCRDYQDADTSPSIIGGRIAACYLQGQEFRDSYRLFPLALSAHAKDEFDYRKMERPVREKHKAEICLYQRHDCEYLGELVREFFVLFGDRPTIGNTAMNYLQNFHGFERLGEGADTKLRPFFYGGRCQAFETGILAPNPGERFHVYDVNSMYPHVMRTFDHPVSGSQIVGRMVGKLTAFVDWEGFNSGAVAVRDDDGSLSFEQRRGRFLTTIHEYNAGLETGMIIPHRIRLTIGFARWTKFDRFIDHFYALRLEAKDNGDKLRDTFYKLIMNSAYGKFAQDPRKYENYHFSIGATGIPAQEEMFSPENPNGYQPRFNLNDLVIWSKPSASRYRGFFNVGVGASITGAARSELLRGIAKAKRPIYCDTDSIVCERFSGDVDPSRLGAWDMEARGDLFACAGKKLYALFSLDESEGKLFRQRDGQTAKEKVTYKGRAYWLVKKASKGAVLSGAEILTVAGGDVIRWKSDRPNFKLDGSVEFIERDIRKTG